MLDWRREKGHWPFSSASEFPVVDGQRWHVQRLGQGPERLLVHGAGAASHTWRGLIPLLSPHFRLLALDLPGHGFSECRRDPRGLSLPAMAGALTALLRHLGVSPALAVGHSAGAAILAHMSLHQAFRPAHLVSLNGALLPLHGWRGLLFSPLARLSARGRLLARLYAWRAQDRAAVERVIHSTGSRLDAEGVRLYQLLAGDPDHVAATLNMMAQWDLVPLAQRLPTLPVPLALVSARGDTAVPPADAVAVHVRVKGSQLIEIDRGGHLVHEESPALVGDLLRAIGRQAGLVP